MDNSMMLGIINNAVLLLGLGILFSLVPLDNFKARLSYKIMNGAFISTIVILIMLSPFEVADGVVLDTRSILISVAALFFGPIPTLMAILSASILRLYQGGAGAFTGVLVIVSSGIVGHLFRIYRYDKIKDRKYYRLFELYIFGIVVHLVMLLLFFTLPRDIRIPILQSVSLYVLLIYPIVTVIYGTLMFLRHDNVLNNAKLLQSQENFVVAVEEAPIPIIIHADDGEVIMVNKAWTSLSGYTIKDIPTIFDWIKKAYSKDDYVSAIENIQKLFLIKEKVHEGEIKIKTKDHQIKTWDFYSSALEALPDGRKSVLSVATDVTERRKLEKN